MNDDAFKKALIKKLDDLTHKIDALIQVVVITSRKETIEKGKTKTDQIVTLSDLGLPRQLIALIVGSTPGAVSSRLSQLKAENAKEGENVDE